MCKRALGLQVLELDVQQVLQLVREHPSSTL